MPVVYAPAGEGKLVLPVDTVKPKSRTNLARLDALRRDPRCVLLVDHYEGDWSRLWWVRVHARATVVDAGTTELPSQQLTGLQSRYPEYRAPGAISALVVLQPTLVRGWSAR